MSGTNVGLWHDRWRPRGIALPIAGGVPDHGNPETVIRRAHRAGEARYEPPTRLAAGIDTGYVTAMPAEMPIGSICYNAIGLERHPGERLPCPAPRLTRAA